MFGNWRRRWTLVYVNVISDRCAQYRFQDPDGHPIDLVADHRRLTVDEITSHLERLAAQRAVVSEHFGPRAEGSTPTDR